MVPLRRVREYENLGLGLFIHWGLYSSLNQGEWTEYIKKLNKRDYEKIIDNFGAEEFDATKIVETAKNMGAKYIVLTVKHHEGFFLYDTKGLSNFDSVHSKANRDFVREFVNACMDEGIKPFFYMATYDWHSPLYEDSFDEYLEYLKKSVKILCTEYGKIGGIWFDGNWDKPDADWKQNDLYKMIRHYQPDAIIMNNTGLENMGKSIDPEIDAVTYERGKPETIHHESDFGKYVAGEISLTLNKHWGAAKEDINFVSPKEVIEDICNARKIGANILINTGLDGNGAIPPMDYQYLVAVSKWMSQYGESIHGFKSRNGVVSSNKNDFVLFNDRDAYIFIFDLKNVGNKNVVLGGEGVNPRSFTGFKQQIKSISWMDNQEKLDFLQNKDMLTINATGFPYGVNYVVRVAKVKF